MGFDVRTVVSAFESVGVDQHGGKDYDVDEDTVSDITARLFGEA